MHSCTALNVSMCALSHSVISESLWWMVAHQGLLSMEFSRKEYWSSQSFPIPGGLPSPRFKPTSLVSSALTGTFLTTVPPRKHNASPNSYPPRTSDCDHEGLCRCNYVKLRSCWSRVGPKPLLQGWFPCKGSHEDGSRDWSDAATSQETVSRAGSHQKPTERPGADSFP